MRGVVAKTPSNCNPHRAGFHRSQHRKMGGGCVIPSSLVTLGPNHGRLFAGLPISAARVAYHLKTPKEDAMAKKAKKTSKKKAAKKK